jgi:hypothetical protein
MSIEQDEIGTAGLVETVETSGAAGKNPFADFANQAGVTVVDELEDTPQEPFPIKDRKPWQGVDASDVREAIRGTGIEKIVNALASVTKPPLPIEITLPKALALAGTALSQPYTREWNGVTDEFGNTKQGADLLKLRILTAGGQACNVWAMTVANSGTGKDIGNIPAKLASLRKWLIGSSGSAEGLKDAFVETGSGLLIVSELGPFLNPKRWQHTCSEFLVSAFNQGWFKENLSKRGKGAATRETRFCYPSLISNIQPQVLESFGEGLLNESGFLPRFLIAKVRGVQNWRPVNSEINYRDAEAALAGYEALEGIVKVPEDYMQHIMDEFILNEAVFPSHYVRLVNEYSARFAVMLSPTPLNPSSEDWARATVLVRWFYSMAEEVLLGMKVPMKVKQMEDRLERYLHWIVKRKVVSKTEFSRNFSRNTICMQRDKDLMELVDRGLIYIREEGSKSIIRAA